MHIKLGKLFLKANITIQTEIKINYRWPCTRMRRKSQKTERLVVHIVDLAQMSRIFTSGSVSLVANDVPPFSMYCKLCLFPW
jgi:hypothetical protein